MGESHTHVEHPDVQREPRDVNIRAIILIGIGIIALAAILHIMLWLLFEVLADRHVGLHLPPPPLEVPPRGPLPPRPRLQSSPSADLRDMRAEEDAILHSYGWVDEQAGVVRIPIERAMELLAERGLPVRPAQEGHGNAPSGPGSATAVQGGKQEGPQGSASGRSAGQEGR
jgi:hypothetical protein